MAITRQRRSWWWLGGWDYGCPRPDCMDPHIRVRIVCRKFNGRYNIDRHMAFELRAWILKKYLLCVFSFSSFFTKKESAPKDLPVISSSKLPWLLNGWCVSLKFSPRNLPEISAGTLSSYPPKIPLYIPLRRCPGDCLFHGLLLICLQDFLQRFNHYLWRVVYREV